MTETTFVWHKATEERPAKSGYYIILCERYRSRPYVGSVTYSKVHDKFNCEDKDDDPSFAFEPMCWAESDPLEVFV